MTDKIMFAPEGDATRAQVAMVMACHGDPDQMEEAAGYLGIDHLSAKLENIISGYGINQDDGDWLRFLLDRGRKR